MPRRLPSNESRVWALPGSPLVLLGVLIWVGAFVLVVLRLPSAGLPGWDETAHAFAALRMAEALKALDLGRFFTELHRPDTYTGPGRLWMIPAFFFGSSFSTPRLATIVVWFVVIALAALLVRRLQPARRDAATFWTIVFGVTSWLGIDFARTAFQEVWCTLWILLGIASWLGARERAAAGRATAGVPWSALLCGLVLGFTFVVKANYGLYLAAALGIAQLSDLIARPDGLRAGRVALGTVAGCALVLGWWFVWPLPAGIEIGAEHRAYLVRFLTNNAQHQSGFGAGYVLVVWMLESCLSPVVFGLQCAGLVFGLARWRDPLARIAVVLALIGLGAFTASESLRVDRFLVPVLPLLWILAGVVAASLIERVGELASRRARLLAYSGHAALLVVILATRGVGQFAVTRASGVVSSWNPEVEALVRERVDPWTRPLGERLVTHAAPVGVDAMLAAAVRHLDPRESFLWIGGTRTELPIWLVEWRLFQASGAAEIVRRERDPWKRDHFWDELAHADGQPFSQADFDAFAARFPQVVVLDPPDTRGKPTEFETRYGAWMSAHGSFALAATEWIPFEVRPGELQEIAVRFYRRK